MKSNGFLSFVFIFIFLAACAAGPSIQESQNADYGAVQTPSDCVTIVESKLRAAMKDPDSSNFTHNDCYKGWLSSVPLYGLPVQYGYVQTGQVNAKNSFGGYVGFRPYTALVRNGYVVRYCITDNDGFCFPRN